MLQSLVIRKDTSSEYGVVVPDLPGCVTAGKSIDEALAMAKEAIELDLEGLIESGEMPPPPRSVETHRGIRAYRHGTWALVPVDASSLGIRSVRVGITLPERVLEAVDRHAKLHQATRSGLLARAAVAYIGRDDRTLPTVAQGGSRLKRVRRGWREAS